MLKVKWLLIAAVLVISVSMIAINLSIQSITPKPIKIEQGMSDRYYELLEKSQIDGLSEAERREFNKEERESLERIKNEYHKKLEKRKGSSKEDGQ